MTYDEDAYLKRVSTLLPFKRIAWAAGAAELLLPTARRLPDEVVLDEKVDLLRRELDQAWAAAEGDGRRGTGRSDAEQLIPDDEIDGFRLEHGLLQNVAASVAYATWCAASAEAQHAVWGWRQVYEIVDMAIETRADRQSADRSGLPDVGVIIDIYLTMLESSTIDVFRSALRTRGEPLSAALVSAADED